MDCSLQVKTLYVLFLTLAIMQVGCVVSLHAPIRPSKPVVNGDQTGTPSDYGTFDSTGKFVAASDQDWVDIFESSSGRLYHSIKIPEGGNAVSLWFSNHGTLDIITQTAIYTYSVKSAKLVNTKEFPISDGITQGDPDPIVSTIIQGDFLLRCAYGSKKLEVWDLRSQSFQSMPNTFLYYGLFSSGKELIAIAGGNSDLNHMKHAMAYLIKVPSGDVIAKTPLDTYGDFEHIGCSPDSTFCLIGVPEGHLVKWGLKKQSYALPSQQVEGFGISPSNIQISPDSKYAALSVVGPDGRVDVIDCTTGKMINYCLTNVDGWTGTAFSRDGKRMVLGDPAGAAIYRVLDGQKLVVLPNHH